MEVAFVVLGKWQIVLEEAHILGSPMGARPRPGNQALKQLKRVKLLTPTSVLSLGYRDSTQAEYPETLEQGHRLETAPHPRGKGDRLCPPLCILALAPWLFF